MLSVPVFLCIGFMVAVLYMDLVFDMSALPHRRSGAPLPAGVLDPIATYYRYITRNPYLLSFVMLTTTGCIVVQIVYALVPRWVGWVSLVLMTLAMSTAILKVIPTAQRLAAGQDAVEQQTRMVHSILPFHLMLLTCILLLAGVQFFCTGSR